MPQLLLTVVFFFFLTVQLSAQPGDLPEDREPGKCYAKALILPIYDIYEEEFPVYIGDEPEKIDLDTIELVLQAETTKWEKRKANRNCLSKNPEDCLVWCLIEVPEKIVTIVYMLDPSQSDMVDWEVYEVKELDEEGGHTEWREVICSNKLTPAIVRQIQVALQNEGYYDNTSSKKEQDHPLYTTHLDVQTKAALTKYQKNNGLPVGQLDIETLQALGIFW